jgi:hypothetical protein
MSQDYLKECNDQGVPPDDFALQFCRRCRQPECSRSQVGESRFEQRVSTWEDRLFLQVPTMSPEDPRYPRISAQKFIRGPSRGRTPEVRGSWVTPKELEKSEPKTIITPQGNTPYTPGQMIKGAPPTTPKPVKDPWEAQPPKNTTENVVLPGAKIRLAGV